MSQGSIGSIGSISRVNRVAALAAAVLVAGIALTGCVSGGLNDGGVNAGGADAAPADPSRPVEELPTRSPTPTPVAEPDPIRVSGEGPGTVEIANPYYPFAQGRDRLSFAGRFACDGPGEFHVALLPESSGVYMGGSECGGFGGGYTMPIERSQETYTVQITVDPGTTWTFSGQLEKPQH